MLSIQGIPPYQRTVYKCSKIRRMQSHSQPSQIHNAADDSSSSGNSGTSANIISNTGKSMSYPNQAILQQPTRHHSNSHQTTLISHGTTSAHNIQPDSHGKCCIR